MLYVKGEGNMSNISQKTLEHFNFFSSEITVSGVLFIIT